MKEKTFLAFDLGAESGRTIVGSLIGQQLEIKELNRFLTGMIYIKGHYFWNISLP